MKDAKWIAILDSLLTQDTKELALKLMSTTFKMIVVRGTQWNTCVNSTEKSGSRIENESPCLLGPGQRLNGTCSVSRIQKNLAILLCGLSLIHFLCQLESKFLLPSPTLSWRLRLSACAAPDVCQLKKVRTST